MRTTAAIAWLAAAATLGTAVALWPSLPERVPMHFDAAGRPDGHVDRSLAAWLLLPGTALAITGLLAEVLPRATAAMARSGSRWLNVPQRPRFLAMAPDARVRAVEPVLQALALAATWCSLMFLYLEIGIHRVAAGETDVLPSWPALLAVAAILATVVQAVARTSRAIARGEAASTTASGA